MPIQRRTINIGSVLGTLAPEPSEASDVPLAPGFSEGESVMKKRKKGEEGVEVAREQQALIQTEPSKELPTPWSCEFYVNGRPVNEDDSVWKSKDVKGGQIADAVGNALLLPKDMKAWKGSNSKQMIENLKRDLVVRPKRLLNESIIENDRLREVEKTASARIQEVESQHKTVEEGLQTAECQLVEISAKLEREWWVSALEQAAVNDSSELYALGREYRPFNSGTPENLEEVNVEGLKDFEAENPMPEAVEVLGH
uniref:Uncharacterized protein n=1 Tax=Fagus sylvatica TaxID=28930 RepID=A0A2N9EEL8_FAGSY